MNYFGLEWHKQSHSVAFPPIYKTTEQIVCVPREGAAEFDADKLVWVDDWFWKL